MATFNLTDFRDPALAHKLIDRIDVLASRLAATERFGECSIKLMEVCGTHTMAIAKAGLRSVMPNNIQLSSGPGCPVCVTANQDIDTAIELARQPGITLATFGDMMRVPGSWTSLATVKATENADVRVVYSPLDALALAQELPERKVIFISVGFETTTPIIAATVKRAEALGLKNFFVFCANKTVPGVLRALADDPEIGICGLILPGHVSTIIGTVPYQFLAAEFNVPGVVTGFEPVDVLLGIEELLEGLTDVAQGKPAHISIAYGRGVKPEGNPVAVALCNEVFEPCDALWRGLGLMPDSGLTLRKEYKRFDALEAIPVAVPQGRETPGCQCGEVLRGMIPPSDCRLFGRACTPEHPIGPCMVSSEGSCAAYYRYRDVESD